ncbi:hypothetical protein [Methylibium sp.]
MLIVWDGAAQDKAASVREYLESTRGAVQMAGRRPSVVMSWIT